MTTELETRKSSLLDIEMSWLPLVEARLDAEEIENVEERARAIVDADVALANHASKEVQKVDGVIGFRRFMETIRSAARVEEKRQSRRAQIAESVLKQLDASVLYAMQSANRKRIDGQRGALVAKGNGGVQPLIITDEKAIPLGCKKATVVMGADDWEKWREHMLDLGVTLISESVEIDNRAIREAIGDEGGIPGAYLAERGQHIEVR